MAFQRSSRFKRRAGSSSFRSRPRLREPKRTGYWQRANLSLFSEHQQSENNSPQNTVLVIGQIDDHFGDDATGQGRTLNNFARRLEIGGITFDWRMWTIESFESVASATTNGQLLLCSDRLDSDGNPAAIDCAWHTNTSPIVLASASEIQDEEEKFPTRVHWRRAGAFDDTILTLPSISGEALSSVGQNIAQGHSNLRLRLSLSDEQVLAFHFHSNVVTSNNLGETNSLTIRVMIQGSLYYRIRT